MSWIPTIRCPNGRYLLPARDILACADVHVLDVGIHRLYLATVWQLVKNDYGVAPVRAVVASVGNCPSRSHVYGSAVVSVSPTFAVPVLPEMVVDSEILGVIPAISIPCFRGIART